MLDAPSIYLKRDWRGDLRNLQVTDGSTIKPVIDDWGRMPDPIVWTGQPFIWNGQAITAENFTEMGFKALNGYLWPPSWQQILKGLPAVSLTELDLLYRPLNRRPGHVFGYSPVEQVLMTVNIATRRTTSQLEYFREGSQPDALFAVAESWTPDQIQRYQDYFDNLLAGNLGQRRKMKFIPAGSKSAYIPTKEPPLKNEFDEWLARIVAFAFSYPPTPFLNLNNRSVAEQHAATGEEEGLEPLKQWFVEVANTIISDHLGEDDIEFSFSEADEVDQAKQKDILTGYAEDGILTINEVRERLGEPPLADPAAGRPMVKTMTGYVDIGQRNPDPAGDATADGPPHKP